jgi:hypothetical protein
MITFDVIFLLVLALINLFAAGMSYCLAVDKIEENKSPIFWHIMLILNLACAIKNAIEALALLG